MRRGDGSQASKPHHCSTFLHSNSSHKSLHLCSPLSSCKVYQFIPGCNMSHFFGSKLLLGNHHNPPNTRTERYTSHMSGNSTCICSPTFRISSFTMAHTPPSSATRSHSHCSLFPFPPTEKQSRVAHSSRRWLKATA